MSDATATFELLEAREILECGAVRLAASKANDSQIRQLFDLVAQMDDHLVNEDREGFKKLDNAFHALINSASGNRFLSDPGIALNQYVQQFIEENIELLPGLKEDGSVYPYESTLDDGNIYTYFAQGKFAMFMSGSYVVSNLSADFPEFQDYRIVQLPVPEGGQSGEYNLLPGTGVYYMSTHTKHPDEAWLWLDWLSSRDHHKRMVAETSNFSVYADLNTAENIQDAHTLQAYEALTAYGVYSPFPPARNPQTALVSPEPVTPDVGDLLVGIYTGQIRDWQSALDDLDMRKGMAFEDALLAAQDSGANVSWEDFIFIDWNPMEDYTNYPTE